MKVERILEGGLVIMLCAFVSVLYLALRENAVKVGDKAPNFSITADNGKTFTARNFGGKLLILNFWASWCPPCVQEAPSMENLATLLGPSGVVVLGVSEDEDPKAYKEFLDKFRVTYPTARDPTKKIKTEYGTVLIPETYFIDSNGRVIEKIVSSTNWSSEEMIKHVQSLL